jgi:superfamily I DNA and RNA helicase
MELMNPSFDYIIRIYRYEKDKPQSFVGIVEEVGKKGKKAFNTYDELWEILNSSKKKESKTIAFSLRRRE